MRDWYNNAPAAAPTATVTWQAVFACWKQVQLDFHTTFGVDFGDGVLDRRSWPWFVARIGDLLSTKDSRLANAVRLHLTIGDACG